MFYLLLVLLVGLLVLGVVLDNTPGGLLIAISGMCLFFVILIWSVTYVGVKSFINAKYPAMVETIENSRTEEMSEIERAALTNEMLEINSQIASWQYWNNTILDPFYPDEVMRLKLLK